MSGFCINPNYGYLLYPIVSRTFHKKEADTVTICFRYESVGGNAGFGFTGFFCKFV